MGVAPPAPDELDEVVELLEPLALDDAAVVGGSMRLSLAVHPIQAVVTAMGAKRTDNMRSRLMPGHSTVTPWRERAEDR